MGQIRTLEDQNAKPDQNVIDALEDALTLARSGQMRGVVINGNLVGHEWYSRAEGMDGLIMLGHLDIAKETVRRGINRD